MNEYELTRYALPEAVADLLENQSLILVGDYKVYPAVSGYIIDDGEERLVNMSAIDVTDFLYTKAGCEIVEIG